MSSYTDRASEAEALAKVLIDTLKVVPENDREAALAKACSDPHVERAITREVAKSFKQEPTFSALTKGISNYGSMSVANNEQTQPGRPSELAKRRAKSRGGI